MLRPDVPRIAILGAGPIGLEAALYAQTLGFPVTVYERGRVGENVQRWGHIRLFTPFGMNTTPLGKAAIAAENPRHDFPPDNACTTGKEHVSVYLEPLAKTSQLRSTLRLETRGLHISRRGLLKEDDPGDDKRARQPFRLLVREAKNRERFDEADVVLDCTGTYGHHRWMGDGGIPAVGEEASVALIGYGLDNVLGDRRSYYAGKNVLVVGGGYSAATTVCHLAELAEQAPETWITWLARCQGSQPILRIQGDPLKERDRLAARANMLATRGEGNVEFHKQAAIDVIDTAGPDRGFRLTGRCAGKQCTWDVDRIVANVGYTPDTNLCRELQVHDCYATLGPMNVAAALLKQQHTDPLKINASGPAALRNPEPNFFILGAKSYGRNSQFLLRAGFDQVRDVFTLITGKPDLNLYKPALKK
jgi:thioredoxin reductase